MQFVFRILLLTLFACKATAQNKYPVVEIPGELLGVKEGLSQGFVSGIIQDKEGFMWFATNDGLNKYDGYKVTVYRNDPKDPASLPDNWLSGIIEDDYGNFWVATQSKGLFLFDKRTERFYPILLNGLGTNTGIKKIAFHQHKLMVVASDNACLYEIEHVNLLNDFSNLDKHIHLVFNFNEHQKKTSLQAIYSNMNLIYWMRNKTILMVNRDTVLQYQADEDYSNWTEKGYRPEEMGILRNESMNATPVPDKLDDGHIFVAANNHLNLFDIKNGKLIGSMALSTNNRSLNIIEMSNGDFLIEMGHRYFHYNITSSQVSEWKMNTINRDFGLVTSFTDVNGITWLGTNGYGVIKIDMRKNYFHTHRELHNLSPFNTLDSTRMEQLPADFTQKYDLFEFNNITIDLSGAYWIYIIPHRSKGKVLLKYDPQTHKLNQISKYDEPVFRWHIYNDHQDRLWLAASYGLNDQYMNLLNKETGSIERSYKIPSATLVSERDFVRDFYEDHLDNFYLATDNGLYLFRPDAKDSNDRWKIIQHNDSDASSLSSNSLWCICADPAQPEKFLWLGTTGTGLDRFEIASGKCIHFTEKDGLPNDVVYGILPDKLNNLWMSTNKGLSCFNPDSKTFQNYTSEDGLQGDEFNHYQYMKLKTGELLFCGVNGYTYFKPEEVLQKQKEVPIVFTGLSISNKVIDWKANQDILNAPVNYTKTITLQPWQNMFTISFASLEYRSNQKKFYKYKLDGFTSKWTEPTNKNEATFTNLSPGTYTLTVTGTNSDGVWNEKGRSIEIVILPAWYQTWWFRTIVVLILASLIYLLYRYRLQEQTRLLTMRNRIATDLHDEIGSTLSSITIYSEAAKKITRENTSAAKVLNKISSNATEVMETMSDIVWAINSGNDKIDNLINRIRIYAVQLSESANFQLHLAGNEHIPDFKLDMYQRKHVYLLFKEAMNNIVKYADCRNVWIDFSMLHKTLVMTIKDDGKGFDIHKTGDQVNLGGNGLFNMNNRAQDLNGHLKITSVPGAGTIIELIMKL